jgi:hypothetical protein
MLLIVFDGGPEDYPTLLDVWPPNVEWFEEELSEIGLSTLLGIEGPVYDWMLRNGVDPNRKTWVRVGQPTYTRDYWGDHDVIYGDVDVFGKPSTNSTFWADFWEDPRWHK